MSFYNKIFAATFRYYSKYKNEAPRFSAVCVVAISQLLLLLLLILLKKANIVDILGIMPSKYYFIPIFILWLIIVYRYYSQEKIFKLIDIFEQMPLMTRRIWGIITIICLIFPVVIIAIL